MVRRILPLLFLALLSVAVCAQTATYTWTSTSTANETESAEFATIDGQPNNQGTGYAGEIEIINGSQLWLMELPYTLGFPNNGFLDCESPIAFGAKSWGTRADGSTMDGSRGGDYYYKTGTTACPLWNGTTNISFAEYRVFITHHSCFHGRCNTWLVDTLESGAGTATVQ